MLGVKDQTLVGLENFNWSDSGNTFCLSESEFSLGILNKGQPFSENTFGSQDNTQMIFRIAKKKRKLKHLRFVF